MKKKSVVENVTYDDRCLKRGKKNYFNFAVNFFPKFDRSRIFSQTVPNIN